MGGASEQQAQEACPPVEHPDNALDASKTDQKKKKKKSGTNGSGGFQSMGLSPSVFRAVMKRGYRVPTPIQRKCIPLVMQGRDVVAMARTGSGKTAAFLIPILERLTEHAAVFGARALVLSPTRELAIQTSKYARELGKFTSLRHCLLLGGDSMNEQFEALSANPDLIIATPGRLLHVMKSSALRLSSVEYVVFDEADRLFEMGFAPQLRQILAQLPESRQTLLFSATMPQMLMEFTSAGLSEPQLVRLDADRRISPNLALHSICVRPDEKYAALLYLLRNIVEAQQDQQNERKNVVARTLIFVCTRHHVELVHRLLEASGLESTFIFGSMDASARKINLGKFRVGKSPLMVVTDVAARGLDLPLLDNVINLHFPSQPKLFVHRVGRVARAGRSGTAYSLIEPEELPYFFDLCVFLGSGLPQRAKLGDSPSLPKPPTATTTSNPSRPILGSMPFSLLDSDFDSCRQLLEHQLSNQVQICGRAYKLYVRTRPGATPSSAFEAKRWRISELKVHPILAPFYSASESAQDAIKEEIAAFKPRGTVFEIGGGDETMRQKRDFHQRIVSTMRGETVDANSANNKNNGSSFRDEKHFLTAAANELDNVNVKPTLKEMVLDLDGEDSEMIRRMRSIRRWDAKKKKFVRVADVADQKMNLRNESGARVNAEGNGAKSSSSQLYAKWCRKNRKEIPAVGELVQDQQDQQKGLIGGVGGRYRHGQNRLEPVVAGAGAGDGARDELKHPAQIRKKRIEMERKSQRKSAAASSSRGGRGKKRKRR